MPFGLGCGRTRVLDARPGDGVGRDLHTGKLASQVGESEPAQVQRLGDRELRQLRHLAVHCEFLLAAPGWMVRADRRNDDQAVAGRGVQCDGEQIAAGRIGPVQIVDLPEHQPIRRESLEQVGCRRRDGDAVTAAGLSRQQGSKRVALGASLDQHGASVDHLGADGVRDRGCRTLDITGTRRRGR